MFCGHCKFKTFIRGELIALVSQVHNKMLFVRSSSNSDMESQLRDPVDRHYNRSIKAELIDEALEKVLRN